MEGLEIVDQTDLFSRPYDNLGLDLFCNSIFRLELFVVLEMR